MRKNFRIGPGAASLMLVAVVVALSLLALLSLIEAHGDHKLSVRSIEFAVSEYEASALAEHQLAELDGVLFECGKNAVDYKVYLADVMDNLPDGMIMIDNIISWKVATPNGRVLYCSVSVNDLDSSERFTWQEHIFEGSDDQF